METLYRMKKHLIVVEKEKAEINFFKALDMDNIFFEGKSGVDFELNFEGQVYTNKDCKINNINYEENGDFLIIEYENINRQFFLKAVYRYIDSYTIERYYIFKSRFSGKLLYFNFLSEGLNLNNDCELIVPLDSKFSYKKESNLSLKESGKKSSGIFLFNDEKNKENLSVWYFGGFEGELNKQDNNISLNINLNKELKAKEELLIGAQYYKFYDGSYIEAIETLAKFYSKQEKINKELVDKSKLKLNNDSGPFNYKTKDVFFNKNFSELLYALYKGKINSVNFKRWLAIEKAIKPLNSALVVYGYENRKQEDYSENLKESYSTLSYLIGEIDINKKNEKYYNKILKLSENDDILKRGSNFFNYINSNKNSLAMVKKFKNSFYVFLMNTSFNKEFINLNFKENFKKDNFKMDRYKLKNIYTNKLEMIVSDFNDLSLELLPYEVKILKFEALVDLNLKGNVIKLNKFEDILNIENSFYSMLFNIKRPMFQRFCIKNSSKSIISNMNFTFIEKKEEIKFKSSKNRIDVETKDAKLTYLYDESNSLTIKGIYTGKKNKNYIEFEIEDFKNYIINDIIGKEDKVLKEFSKIKFIGENLLEFYDLEHNFKSLSVNIKTNKLRISFNKENEKSYFILKFLII